MLRAIQPLESSERALVIVADSGNNRIQVFEPR